MYIASSAFAEVRQTSSGVPWLKRRYCTLPCRHCPPRARRAAVKMAKLLFRVLPGDPLHEDDEFVAAKRPMRSSAENTVAEAPQCWLAFCLPPGGLGVVDLFEIIQIDHQQGRGGGEAVPIRSAARTAKAFFAEQPRHASVEASSRAASLAITRSSTPPRNDDPGTFPRSSERLWQVRRYQRVSHPRFSLGIPVCSSAKLQACPDCGFERPLKILANTVKKPFSEKEILQTRFSISPARS